MAATDTRGIASPGSTTEGYFWAWSDSRAISLTHRAGAGLIRRVVPETRRERALRAFRIALHRGSRVECPVCGSRFRHFMSRWNKENAICWRCGSEERHRALWLLLERQRPDLLGSAGSLLHFAPETGLAPLVRRRVERYVTGDLNPDAADLTLDLTSLDLPDASFDATICSHVLEHIPDDAAAMRELHRVLTPGGWAIVMVPLNLGLPETLEDPGIEDPAERRRILWQEDHVRLYGLDIADRLERAGFRVERLRPSQEASPEEAERFRLGHGNDVFLCWRDGDQRRAPSSS